MPGSRCAYFAMEQKPSVILGKPMRKYKPSLITEEDVKFESNEAKSPISPSKPAKTLLEESLDFKQSEAPVNHPESIGVDKRLLLSVLAAKNSSEPLIGCGWEPFSYVKSIPQAQMDKIRKARKIIVEGANIPPLALKFKDMRIPDALCEYLDHVKKISDPSLIQMQGIPVALSGRDLIGIASTGSGKTLSFCIPLLLFALESELKLPIAAGEGPVGIILAPSVRNLWIHLISSDFLERVGPSNFSTM